MVYVVVNAVTNATVDMVTGQMNDNGKIGDVDVNRRDI